MTHIATDEILLDHASGAVSPPMALLLATHLTLNPEARRRYRALEALGGTLLDGIAPTATRADALDRLFARIDAGDGRDTAAAVATAPPQADTALPAPLRAQLGDGLERLGWRQLTRGVQEAPLAPVQGDGPRASLLRIAAGRAVPRHTHRGDELTLVLAGAFDDENGHYARGDLAIADPDVEHQPVAARGQDCLCLVVAAAPIRLTGPFLRLLNPFLGR